MDAEKKRRVAVNAAKAVVNGILPCRDGHKESLRECVRGTGKGIQQEKRADP